MVCIPWCASRSVHHVVTGVHHAVCITAALGSGARYTCPRGLCVHTAASDNTCSTTARISIYSCLGVLGFSHSATLLSEVVQRRAIIFEERFFSDARTWLMGARGRHPSDKLSQAPSSCTPRERGSECCREKCACHHPAHSHVPEATARASAQHVRPPAVSPANERRP